MFESEHNCEECGMAGSCIVEPIIRWRKSVGMEEFHQMTDIIGSLLNGSWEDTLAVDMLTLTKGQPEQTITTTLTIALATGYILGKGAPIKQCTDMVPSIPDIFNPRSN